MELYVQLTIGFITLGITTGLGCIYKQYRSLQKQENAVSVILSIIIDDEIKCETRKRSDLEYQYQGK